MRTSSHLLLGRTLADHTPLLSAYPLRRNLFLLGNIVPDFIPFTYFTGFRTPPRTAGHSLPYSQPKIAKKIKKGRSLGFHSAGDAFRLGLLMHYLSDSFTYPHTLEYHGTKKEHTAHEKALCAVLPEFLFLVNTTEPACSPEFLAEAKRQYNALPPSLARDAEWIVKVCSAVFFSVLSVNEKGKDLP